MSHGPHSCEEAALEVLLTVSVCLSVTVCKITLIDISSHSLLSSLQEPLKSFFLAYEERTGKYYTFLTWSCYSQKLFIRIFLRTWCNYVDVSHICRYKNRTSLQLFNLSCYKSIHQSCRLCFLILSSP